MVTEKFIGQMPWDHQPLVRLLAADVGNDLDEPDGVIVFDPSAFPKKGDTHTWIADDDEMGRPSGFRLELRALGERYLLAVPSKTLNRDVEAALPEYSGRGRHPKNRSGRLDERLPVCEGFLQCLHRDRRGMKTDWAHEIPPVMAVPE
jgi:hypothetical protein